MGLMVPLYQLLLLKVMIPELNIGGMLIGRGKPKETCPNTRFHVGCFGIVPGPPG
jgi:hypothetical protein